MAKMLITVSDDPASESDIRVEFDCDQPIDTNPDAIMPPAFVAGLDMIRYAVGESAIKQDFGLKKFIQPESKAVHMIARTDVGLPQFFSLLVGRDNASPLGGWTTEPAKGLQFARAKDAEKFMEHFLMHAAPFCEVVEHG